MKTNLNKSLKQSLQSAVSSHKADLKEEQGGFILKNKKTDTYEFIRIVNTNTGTSRAAGLYTANGNEFAHKVLTKIVMDDNCEIYASFHTHPDNYPARPSNEDLTKLFTSFPVNFIYAPVSKELNMFTYKKDDKGDYWSTESIKL